MAIIAYLLQVLGTEAGDPFWPPTLTSGPFQSAIRFGRSSDFYLLYDLLQIVGLRRLHRRELP